ncbi:MAG: cysteine methyltransferase [Candidatus Dormibacteraeota bacterium]|nr:cysteine methyltransferase [Candidatus Dormibacteraeota bacterium]
MSAFQADVRVAVLGIPLGGVLTYGEVALVAGHPGAARAVGRALAQSSGLPWWRVVGAEGRLAPRLAAEQATMLKAEGVLVAGGRALITHHRSKLVTVPSGPESAWPCPGSARATLARPRRRRP